MKAPAKRPLAADGCPQAMSSSSPAWATSALGAGRPQARAPAARNDLRPTTTSWQALRTAVSAKTRATISGPHPGRIAHGYGNGRLQDSLLICATPEP